MSTPLTKANATKMTAFWSAYWTAKQRNDQALMAAAQRMMEAATKRRPASDEDWALLEPAMAAK